MTEDITMYGNSAGMTRFAASSIDHAAVLSASSSNTRSSISKKQTATAEAERHILLPVIKSPKSVPCRIDERCAA